MLERFTIDAKASLRVPLRTLRSVLLAYSGYMSATRSCQDTHHLAAMCIRFALSKVLDQILIGMCMKLMSDVFEQHFTSCNSRIYIG
jgi:hypothetical protein